jgi:outer membrane protein assembly factor BamE (lipoprotein component of BamABCDE complex)
MKIRLAFPLIATALLGVAIPPAYAHHDDFHIVVDAVRENAITIGMTQDEVLAKLGPPAMRARYGAGRGPIWSYPVSGAIPGTRAFYVEFDPENRVASTQESSSPAGG